MMAAREPVTNWKNWRDIVASETVVCDLHKYKSKTVVSWDRPKYAAHDQPAPMVLSSYMRLDGKTRNVNLDITLTAQAVAAIRANTIHIDRDTINIKCIVWDDGRALVLAQHSQILGDVWLAKIDASTIPTFPVRYEVRSDEGLEGVFESKEAADKHVESLREIGARNLTVDEE